MCDNSFDFVPDIDGDGDHDTFDYAVYTNIVNGDGDDDGEDGIDGDGDGDEEDEIDDDCCDDYDDYSDDE